jgi:hypothetical protein
LRIGTTRRITSDMPTKTSPIIDVSRRALIGRIERVLRKQNQRLRVDRRGGDIRHIIIDTKKQAIVETDVDLEQLARKLKVLQPWERAAS